MSLSLHILYRAHLLLVRILGGVGSQTEVSLVSSNHDFSTLLCFRGEKSRTCIQIYLALQEVLLWEDGRHLCVLVGQASLFKSQGIHLVDEA